MARKNVRRKLGQPPAPRTVIKPPPSHSPTPHVPAPPVEHPAAKPPNPLPPNPQRPRLMRDVHGGALKDLFQLFPDLPSPPRPPSRKSAAFRYPSPRRPR